MKIESNLTQLELNSDDKLSLEPKKSPGMSKLNEIDKDLNELQTPRLSQQAHMMKSMAKKMSETSPMNQEKIQYLKNSIANGQHPIQATQGNLFKEACKKLAKNIMVEHGL